MTPRYIHWSKHDQTIRDMIDAGKSRQEIADHFGVTLTRLRDAMHRCGITMTDEQRRASQSKTMTRLIRDDEFLAKRLAKSTAPEARRKRSAAMHRRYKDPSYREFIQAHAKKVAEKLGHEFFVQIGKLGGIGSKRARDKAEEEKRALEKMTPFERQLYLVRTGRATVSKKLELKPVVSYDTLGGVATYEG